MTNTPEDRALSHEIIADIKRVSSDIGHAATRDEYLVVGKYGKRQIDSCFGSFTGALQACGLYSTKRRQKSHRLAEINKGLEKDIKNELQNYIRQKPIVATVAENNLPIVAIGDTHFPFSDHACLSAIYSFIAEQEKAGQRINTIVQIGDLYDMLAHSRFPRSLNNYNPFEEMKLGFEQASQMWRRLRELAPNAKCYQLRGNHDIRPLKKILMAYPEGEVFFSIDRYYKFDGVIDVADARAELVIGDTIFMHGYKTRLGDHCQFNLMNTIVGHSHTGGVYYTSRNNHTIWELNCGFTGDAESKAISYTAQKTTGWTSGWGFIDEHGPRFIPFQRGGERR